MPAVGEEGGVGPVAIRIMTPVKFALVGFVQEKAIEVSVVPVTLSPVTAAGGPLAVVAVMVTAGEYSIGLVECEKSAYE